MTKITNISDQDIIPYLDIIFKLQDYRPAFVDLITPLYRDEPRTLREIVAKYSDEEHSVWYQVYTMRDKEVMEFIEVVVKNKVGYLMKQDTVRLK